MPFVTSSDALVIQARSGDSPLQIRSSIIDPENALGRGEGLSPRAIHLSLPKSVLLALAQKRSPVCCLAPPTFHNWMVSERPRWILKLNQAAGLLRPLTCACNLLICMSPVMPVNKKSISLVGVFFVESVLHVSCMLQQLVALKGPRTSSFTRQQARVTRFVSGPP